MANGIENLRTPTTAEARDMGRKGGIASGKARREKKAMKDTLEALLSMPIADGAADDVADIQSLAEIKGKNISVQEAIMLAQIKKAMKGDLQAAIFVRDSSGNKPADGLNINGNVNNPFADLTTEELKKLVQNG